MASARAKGSSRFSAVSRRVMKVNWELSKKMFVAKSALREAEVAVREKATFWFRIRYRQRELKN
jgi:hypothetical protein